MKDRWELLIQWRKVRKLSQQALAVKLGVSVGTIHRWESGKVKPSPLALIELQRMGVNTR